MLASGDVSQTATASRVTNDLIFHFKDGSVHKETTVFSQRRAYRLLTYHLVQKGPSFKTPTDMTLNAATGQVTVRYTDDHNNEKTLVEHMNVPEDVANGLLTTLLNDISPTTPTTKVSLIAATPKPRLVKLAITPEGADSFSIAGASHRGTRYVVKVEIGGISGVVAPIVGKQPPDMHVWMLEGKSPAFLKLEGPLSEGGPVWRIELASPVWPKIEKQVER
jgi:hypothetical protein